MKNEIMPSILSVTMFVGVWAVATNFAPSFLLPTPYATFIKTLKVFFSSEFITHASYSLSKIMISFFAAFMSSNIIAFLGSRSSAFERFMRPLVFIGLQTPALIAVFIAIILLGTQGSVATVVSTIILFYELYIVLLPAYKGLNQEYNELALVYKLTKKQILLHIFLPQLIPSLFIATRLGISIGWKITLISEIFTQNNGVGYQIQRYFSLFSILGVLSWFLSFLLIISFIEFCIILPFEKKLTAYPHRGET